ncbi:MAG: Fic family protein, partial [Deltaproteobacteria bacterium]
MPKRISPNELNVIVEAVATFPGGAGIEEIQRALEEKVPRRTLQRRLALLVEQKRLIVEGRARASRYRLPVIIGESLVAPPVPKMEGRGEIYIPLSSEGEILKQAVRQPLQNRRPVGYNRDFLDSYQPNDTFYLTSEIRHELNEMGRSPEARRPAGTYAR